MRKSLSVACLTLSVAAGVFGCGGAKDQSAAGRPAEAAAPAPPAIVQPGAPGQASAVVSKVPAFSDNNYTPDDVKFMQGMIHHHNQALLMVKLITSNTKTPQLVALGQKIQLSQSGEMQAMTEWLTARKQEVPMLHEDGSAMVGADHHDMAPMPGMLTEAQMKALAAARGGKFDELFLTGMIQHHKGALKMVADLRQAGGGHEPNIGHFLDGVDNDQRMEIVRMYGLLGRPVEW
jgi:uncharacterized protein (DUF305 family)